MTPIERAARALCELDGNPPGATMDGKPLWQDYLPKVRAVLTAIREPSEAMLSGGELDFETDGGGGFNVPVWVYGERVMQVWQGVIDAALAEEG